MVLLTPPLEFHDKMKPNNIQEKEVKKVICPKCKNHNLKKDGKRKTQNRGQIQRYRCKKCNFRFVQDDGFFRMRNNPKKISQSVDLFYRGLSTREIQAHLGIYHTHNCDNSTIYRWVVKYSKMISNFTDKLKLKVGCELQIDEMECNKRGKKSNGWFIDCIDTKTRFMVGGEFSKRRDLEEVKKVLSIAKYKTENQFEIITTDGWLAYPKAIQKTFVLKDKSNTRRFGVTHNQVNASRGEGFNIKIERLHNSVRHRIKTFRGFHGSIESANILLKGYSLYYNFVRRHQSLGKCPYELACPELNLGLDKWMSLIRLSLI